MNKKILVVYSWLSKYGHGFGNVDCDISHLPPTINDIREIERQMREANAYDQVAVINIIDLESEEETDEQAY